MGDRGALLFARGRGARRGARGAAPPRRRGERIGLLELQILWPFPVALVREKSRHAGYVVVVEMNMGQVLQSVKAAVERPERVFLANRVDGVLIAPADIQNILRLIHGKGV